MATAQSFRHSLSTRLVCRLCIYVCLCARYMEGWCLCCYFMGDPTRDGYLLQLFHTSNQVVVCYRTAVQDNFKIVDLPGGSRFLGKKQRTIKLLKRVKKRRNNINETETRRSLLPIQEILEIFLISVVLDPHSKPYIAFECFRNITIFMTLFVTPLRVSLPWTSSSSSIIYKKTD